MKRFLAVLLAVAFVLPVLQLSPLTGGTAFAADPKEIPKKERNLTDEEFLGIWDEESQQWSVAPRINYSYDGGLAPVEEAVKEGDYETASVLLMKYYKETGRTFRFPSSRRNGENNTSVALMCDNVFPRGSLQSSQTITSEEQWYEFEVMSAINAKLDSGVNHAAYNFMGRKKMDQAAVFNSMESGVNAPVLVITVDGVAREYPAVADTYIRAGAYATEVFGGEEKLYVKETGMPTDDDTMRAYVQFNFDDLTAKSKIQSAVIRMYGYTDGPEDMELMMFNSEQLEINEKTQSWNTTGVNFYSWQGKETMGPSEWIEPANCGYDYMASLFRFWRAMGILGVYESTGDEYYAEKLIELILNFYENHGGGGLLLEPKQRGNDTNLAAGFRLQMLVDMYLSLIRSPSLDAYSHLQFVKLIYDDMEFLNYPQCFWGHHASGNNWGAAGNTGLACGVTYFPEFDKQEVWLEELAKRVSYQLDTLILDDGAYIETTNSYSTTVFADFSKYKSLMNDLGYPVPASLDMKMKRFVYSFMNMMEPNGYLTEYGDDGYDFSQDLLDSIYELGQVYDDPYLLYVGSRGAEGSVPDHTSVDYPDGRYTIMRTGWGEQDLFSFVITRPFGTHSHNHGLSMTLYAYGRRLLADTSQRSYDSETISNWQRMRRVSHNVIEIDDDTVYKGWTQNTNLIKGDSDNITAPRYDIFDGYHRETKPEPGSPTVEMKRRILFLKPLNYWIVSDYVDTEDPETPKEHKYNQVWHMAPQANVRMNQSTGMFYSNYGTGANLQIVPADPETLEKSIATDGYMGTNNHKYASYVKRSTDDVTFDTVLFPLREYSEESTSVERLDMGVPTTTASAMKITTKENMTVMNTGYYYTSYEAQRTNRMFASNETDAKTAFININKNGDMDYVMLNEGTKLVRNGLELISARAPVSDLSVEWKQGELAVNSSVSNSAKLGIVQIYAPDENASVTYNGGPVQYNRDGAYIILNPAEPKLTAQGTQNAAVERFAYSIPVNTGAQMQTVAIRNDNADNILTVSGGLTGSFQIGQRRENAALGAKAEASSNQAASGALTDGKQLTSWTASNNSYPQSIELDLGKICEVSDVEIQWNSHPSGLGKYVYQLSVSEDGKNYTRLKQNETAGKSRDMVLKPARYIRLEILDNTFFTQAGISEMAVNTPGSINTDSGSEWKAVFAAGPEGGELSAPMRLSFEGMKDKQFGMVDRNGTVTPITQELTDDSASGLGTNSVAKLVSGDDVIIWTKNTGNFVVYGDASKDDGSSDLDPDEGGGRPSGGGGSGGGGGGVVTPSASPTPTASPTASPSSKPPVENPFTDIETHWAKDDILEMVESGVVKGVTDTSFEPDRRITRAEFTSLVARANGLAAESYENLFADVDGGAWYAREIQAAYSAGLVSGSDGLFRPDDPITREEAVKILVAAWERNEAVESGGALEFADADLISSWAAEYVEKAVRIGLVQGDENGNFNPKKSTTRAEAAVMIKRTMK